MTNNRVAKAVRLAIAFGAASTIALSSSAALAEEAQDNNAEEDEERIQVTGSRIARSELSQPTPNHEP